MLTPAPTPRPFKYRPMGRGDYTRECGFQGWEPMDDEECLEIFRSYDPAKHGSGVETEIAYIRGWAISGAPRPSTKRKRGR